MFRTAGLCLHDPPYELGLVSLLRDMILLML